MLNQFSKHIFWDTKISKLDIKEHKAFIIKRVLEYGKFEDWILLQNIYSLSQIIETAKTFISLDKKTLSLLSVITSTSLEEFKCYNTEQYQQKLWNS